MHAYIALISYNISFEKLISVKVQNTAVSIVNCWTNIIWRNCLRFYYTKLHIAWFCVVSIIVHKKEKVEKAGKTCKEYITIIK